MPVLERDIENKVVAWSRKCNVLDIKLNLLGQRHWPDRVFWIPRGKPLLVEFKRPGEKPRKAQADLHRKLRKLGYVVYVIDNVAEAKRIITEAVEAARLSGEVG